MPAIFHFHISMIFFGAVLYSRHVLWRDRFPSLSAWDISWHLPTAYAQHVMLHPDTESAHIDFPSPFIAIYTYHARFSFHFSWAPVFISSSTSQCSMLLTARHFAACLPPDVPLPFDRIQLLILMVSFPSSYYTFPFTGFITVNIYTSLSHILDIISNFLITCFLLS